MGLICRNSPGAGSRFWGKLTSPLPGFRPASDPHSAGASSNQGALSADWQIDLFGRVAALHEYARLSRLRFDNGYAGYLEVLYAENELFGAELAAVRSQADSYTQVVNVYKAVAAAG